MEMFEGNNVLMRSVARLDFHHWNFIPNFILAAWVLIPTL
jgi:hypothetical protein